MIAPGRTLLCLLAVSPALAGPPAVTLHLRLDTAGAVSVTSVSHHEDLRLTPVMPAVIGCRGRMNGDEQYFGHFRCPDALHRDGLTLEGVFDLSPVARSLAPTDEIQFTVDYPRLGFEKSSPQLKTEFSGRRLLQSGRIPAGAVQPIRVRFGYGSGRLAGTCAALFAMAVAILLAAALVCRCGLPHLHRSVFILGAIVWLAAVWRLQATELLRILLAGSPFAVLAATLLEFVPPLFCVAVGVAAGSGARAGSTPGARFQETFWGYGSFVFPLASGLAAVSFLTEEGGWMEADPWLMVTVITIVVCRRRMRGIAGGTMRRITAGLLSDRVAELAAKAGHKQARLYVSQSTRSRVLNDFALFGAGIVLTAPLVAALTRREVDAIAAHELSHFRHKNYGVWMAFAMAAVLFGLTAFDFGSSLPGLLVAPEVILTFVFLFSLRGARQREFAADAGAVSLTADPRAMISGLATVASHNSYPLEFGRLAEFFSTHPSTHRRIRAIASAARLEKTEVLVLCAADSEGERYTLPEEDTTAVFNENWLAAHAARYGWAILLTSTAAGIVMMILVGRSAAPGLAQYATGIALGCALTKTITEAVMARSYASTARRLQRKLGVQGALVGFAPGETPRLFGGHRFCDIGLLNFEEGRLCYRSERAAIQLGAGNVVGIRMVPAAPAAWFNLQPMICFRNPETGTNQAFILHALHFWSTGRALFQKLERWRSAGAPATASVRGFEDQAGEPFCPMKLSEAVRGFRIAGGLTLLGAMFAGWPLRPDMSGWYALVACACVYLFMMLPLMLYRQKPSAVSDQRSATAVDPAPNADR